VTQNDTMPDIEDPADSLGTPLTRLLTPITRAGGYYARTWGAFLDGQPDELPVARPTLGLAAQAFSDELLLAGFGLLRKLPSTATLDRIDSEVIAAKEFYGDKGWLEHPEGFFPEPPAPTDVTVKRVTSMGRTQERMSFASDYEPHPGEPGRDRWLACTPNNRVYAVVMRHRRPRPWVVCIHGAMMGRAALDPLAFNARHLYRDLDLNVVLPVLPMHGPRTRGLSKEIAFPSEDVLDTVHGAAQSVWDIRRLLAWIRAEQPGAQIALNGISLGGFVSSMVGSLDDELACAILGVPAVDLVGLLSRHAGLSGQTRMHQTMVAAEPLGRMVSALSMTPRVPPAGRFIYAGVADRLVHPRDQVARIWEHWGKPDIQWYQGGHVGFFRSQPVRQFVDAALTQSGLVERAALR